MGNIRLDRFLHELSSRAETTGRAGPDQTHRAGTRGVPRSVREPLILDVAGQVFAGDGFERASMDRIADLAGVSKPMLYAYFGSKQGLYVAYIELTGRELVNRLVDADRDHVPHAVRLRALIAEFLAFVEQHRDGWTVLFHELNAVGRAGGQSAPSGRLRGAPDARSRSAVMVRPGAGGRRRRGPRDRGGGRVTGQLMLETDNR
jgi:AcrR family transcriptional regulator